MQVKAYLPEQPGLCHIFCFKSCHDWTATCRDNDGEAAWRQRWDTAKLQKVSGKSTAQENTGKQLDLVGCWEVFSCSTELWGKEKLAGPYICTLEASVTLCQQKFDSSAVKVLSTTENVQTNRRSECRECEHGTNPVWWLQWGSSFCQHEFK